MRVGPLPLSAIAVVPAFDESARMNSQRAASCSCAFFGITSDQNSTVGA